jgi:hypothetical protein
VKSGGRRAGSATWIGDVGGGGLEQRQAQLRAIVRRQRAREQLRQKHRALPQPLDYA